MDAVGLEAKEDAKASVSLTVADQVTGSQRSATVNCEEMLLPKGGLQLLNICSLKTLRRRPGCLAGDRLVLRARVEVVL